MNKKPFIHLYRTPRGYYFYDVNRDSIITVNSSIFDHLKGNTKYEELSADDRRYIDELKENGYLSDKRMETIRNPLLDTLEDSLNRKCHQLILQVTQACNLVCSYCPYANVTHGELQRDHSNKMMTWETAKAAIDFFYEHSVDNDEVSMAFYGGEPLIAYNLIKKCVDYSEKLFMGKDLAFNMTTNSTLLTDEMIDFFYEHNFSLLFSIDGPEEIHDINRRRSDGTGSFKAAFANLRKTVERYGDKAEKKIGINNVINPANDVDILLDFYKDDFFKKTKINVNLTLADDDMLEDKIEATDRYSERMNYQYFLGLLSALKIVDELELCPSVKSFVNGYMRNYASFKNISEGLPDAGAPGGPCIPGQRRLFVNADGNMLPCERVSEVLDEMVIGSISNGFDMKKAADMLNIGALTPEKCRECYAYSKCQLCGKDCCDENGYNGSLKFSHCQAVYNSFDSDVFNALLLKERRTVYKRRTEYELSDIPVRSFA